MAKIKVSVITTLKNEQELIGVFLDSLFSQSKKADEVVITDGGSTDKTIEIIHKYIKKGYNIQLLTKKGNIAVGRNHSIKNASYEIIAVSDVGCQLDKNWLKNIIDPFKEDKVMAVAGLFIPKPSNLFEACNSALTIFDHDKIDGNWLPSSRSIAFRKKVWQEVGNYPENLTWAGEDTLFDLNIVKAGYKFHPAKNALVYWRPRKNTKEFYQQHYLYACGDGQAKTNLFGYFRRIIIYLLALVLLILTLYNYLFGLLFILLTIAYLIKKIIRVCQKVKHPLVFFYVIYLTLIFDLANISGFIKGLSESKKVNR